MENENALQTKVNDNYSLASIVKENFNKGFSPEYVTNLPDSDLAPFINEVIKYDVQRESGISNLVSSNNDMDSFSKEYMALTIEFIQGIGSIGKKYNINIGDVCDYVGISSD